MRIDQVAAQLYTVREFIRTPSGVAESLKKIKSIGYDAVQISGMGPIDEDELVRILEGEDLACCATHEPGETILYRPEALIERLRKLNCRYTAYPYPSSVPLNTIEDVKAFASRLNSAGEILREAGITLAYHNHHIEFRRVGEKTIIETIYEETDPANLKAEIDTYWVQYGGGDPVAWCRKLKNRLPLLHMKDYIISGENQIAFAEVGRGNLDWKAIIGEAENSGCEWFIVEQDVCEGDPFDSLEMSHKYIKENLACI